MTTPKILIIGAGIGGLVLAQVLRKGNVDFEIYERDVNPGSREQGWAISMEWVLPLLREALPAMGNDISSLAVNARIEKQGGFAIFDAENGNALVRRTEKGEMVRVNRALLRNWLTQGLNINWNKQYKSHSCENGQIRVNFEDGSSVQGSALIGADGVNSRVRTALFEKPQTLETAPVAIAIGIRTLARPDYTKLVDLVDGCHMMCVGEYKRIFTSMRGVAQDLETAEFVWYMSRLDRDPSAIARLSRNELLDQAKRDADDFPAIFKELVQDTTSNDEVVTLPLRTIVLDDIPKGLVTLIGDVAHAMTPFRGEGAQHAIVDSIKLGKAIAEAVKNGPDADFSEIFKIYEAEMLERGRKAVLASREAVHFMHRPLQEWRDQAEQFKKQREAEINEQKKSTVSN